MGISCASNQRQLSSEFEQDPLPKSFQNDLTAAPTQSAYCLTELIDRHWDSPETRPSKPLFSEILSFLPDPQITQFLQNHGNGLDRKVVSMIPASRMRSNQTVTFLDLVQHKEKTGRDFTSNTVKHLKMNDSVITNEALIKLQKAFPYLETVDISHCVNLTNEALAIFPLWTRLRAVNLSYNDHFDQTGYSHLSSCLTLENVQACSSAGINNETMESLSKIPRIRFLNLKNCQNFTDEGLEHFDYSQTLETIILNNCQNISDQGLFYLSHCNKLTTLSLSGCYPPSITDLGMSYLSTCPRLATIDLSRCKKITNQSLFSIAKCPNLKFANLSFCQELTSKGFLAFINCKNLTFLNLYFTDPKASPEIFYRLLMANEKLNIIYADGGDSFDEDWRNSF